MGGATCPYSSWNGWKIFSEKICCRKRENVYFVPTQTSAQVPHYLQMKLIQTTFTIQFPWSGNCGLWRQSSTPFPLDRFCGLKIPIPSSFGGGWFQALINGNLDPSIWQLRTQHLVFLWGEWFKKEGRWSQQDAMCVFKWACFRLAFCYLGYILLVTAYAWVIQGRCEVQGRWVLATAMETMYIQHIAYHAWKLLSCLLFSHTNRSMLIHLSQRPRESQTEGKRK